MDIVKILVEIGKATLDIGDIGLITALHYASLNGTLIYIHKLTYFLIFLYKINFHAK